MKKISFILALLITQGCIISGQESSPYKLKISYTVLDIPQNFETYGNYPSMNQTSEISSALYDISFLGINALGDVIFKKKNTSGEKIANIGFKYLAGLAFSRYASELPVPLGVFAHEEFHRSVLGMNGFNAINGNWLLNRWDGTVYGLTDEDLSTLKQNNVQALLYSYVSGIHSENYLTQINVIQDFNYRRTYYKNPLYLYNAYYVWDYFNFSTSSESDSVKVLAPPNEDREPENRDFAGADLTAWIYDMFSPETPYTDRDLFPGGEGVNRRIGFSDLTPEGQDYLKKQKKLSLLNFLNPAIFLINRININERFSFMFFTQYSPVHFGNSIALYVPFSVNSINQLFSVRSYNNRHEKFFGIQYGIYNIAPGNNKRLELGGTLSLWNQPVNQSFNDLSGELGGAIELMAEYYIVNGFSAFITGLFKTEGWMIANPYLDNSSGLQIGVRYFIKKY